MSGKSRMDHLLSVLDSPPAGRADPDIDACAAFFKHTKFFRSVGPETDAARSCCQFLALETFEENEVVFLEGDAGDRFFFVLSGSVRLVKGGSVVGELGPGSSFGEIEVLGRDEEEQKRTTTDIAEERTKLASLSRAHYLQAAGGFDAVIQKTLKIPPKQRTSLDQDMLLAQFDGRAGCPETEFFQRLYFVTLQKKCCQCMTPVSFEQSDLELEQKKKGQWYLCIVVSGSLTPRQGGETRTLGENDSFMGETVSKEGGALTATEDGVMAVLSKKDYEAVTSKSFAAIKKVLSSLPHKRGSEDLELTTELFCNGYKTTPFLSALPSAILRTAVCKMLGCEELKRGDTIFREGDPADRLYIIINGTVETIAEDRELQLTSGCEFGHFETHNDRTATATVTSETCLVATLSKPDFVRLCKLDEIQVGFFLHFLLQCTKKGPFLQFLLKIAEKEGKTDQVWVQRFWKLMTTKEPGNDRELREDLFDKLDTDGSGELDRNEIYKLLDSLGINFHAFQCTKPIFNIQIKGILGKKCRK